MAIKGQVLPHEIKPPPKYRYFTNGEYNNPQTHPMFLYMASIGSWWHDYDYEWIKKDGKEITILKIVNVTRECEGKLIVYVFVEIENYEEFKK